MNDFSSRDATPYSSSEETSMTTESEASISLFDIVIYTLHRLPFSDKMRYVQMLEAHPEIRHYCVRTFNEFQEAYAKFIPHIYAELNETERHMLESNVSLVHSLVYELFQQLT